MADSSAGGPYLNLLNKCWTQLFLRTRGLGGCAVTRCAGSVAATLFKGPLHFKRPSQLHHMRVPG
jgi:hypothetical protein